MNMEENKHSVATEMAQKRFGILQVIGIIVIAVLITAGIGIMVFKIYFFPSEFKPVTLNPQEEQVLVAKIENLDSVGIAANSHKNGIPKKTSKPDQFNPNASLEPEPYSEKGVKREINFTERELNALLAKNTDLAKKLAIDLSDNLISAKLLLPVDEDFPILGGKILRVKTGVVIAFDKGKPIVILKGVTIMGVPIPNAWIGGIKNIDLVEEFGSDTGFWKSFSDGIEDIKIEEGLFKLKLKE
jgi:hypothetical protein